MWTTATADEELGLVYLPMGNSAVDYLSRTRVPAEDRFATALVALNAETGSVAWSSERHRRIQHFQQELAIRVLACQKIDLTARN
jgi:glucose dehydrogenase